MYTCYMAHPFKLTISSVWKSPDMFRSHTFFTDMGKYRRNPNAILVYFRFIVDDCYALFLTPNAYGDV